MRGRAMNAMPAEAGLGSAISGHAEDGENGPAHKLPRRGNRVFLL